MIPYAIAGGRLSPCEASADPSEGFSSGPSEEPSFDFAELSPDSFTFRIPWEWEVRFCGPDCTLTMELFFYVPETASFRTITVRFPEEGSLTRLSDDPYEITLRARISQTAFQKEAVRLLSAYSRYIRIRLEEDADLLEAEYAGRKHSLYDLPEGSFADQQKRWAAHLPPLSLSASLQLPAETGLTLSSPSACLDYLSRPFPDYRKDYWEEHALADTLLSGCRITHLYLGSHSCVCLLPDRALLTRLLARCQTDRLQPVLCIPPLSEGNIHILDELIHCVSTVYPHPVEWILNDWGSLFALQKRAGRYRLPFLYTIGPFLYKRRKDSRGDARAGLPAHAASIQTTSMDLPEFRAFLQKDLHIHRIAAEVCGYPASFCGQFVDNLTFSLSLPYYHTAQSPFCTLQKLSRNQDRGTSLPIGDCPRFCEEKAVLYEDSLQLVGYENGLLGFDGVSLRDGRYLADCLRGPVSRLVLNFIGRR